MPSSRLFAFLAALALPFGTVQAVDWDEGLNGVLSGDGDFPTLVGTLSLGSNVFTGSMGALVEGDPIDADIWNFTIESGYYLTGIDLIGYSATGSSGGGAFMAIMNGGTINTGDASQHLSNNLFLPPELDGFGNPYRNLLALLDEGPFFGGDGFDGPLPAGNYTFWIQEGAAQIDYTINFVVSASPVPEPGSALLLGLAGLCLLRRRR